MLKKLSLFVLVAGVSCMLSGCFLLVAAGAGAGTAVWMSNKVTQTFEANFEKTTQAADKALSDLKLPTKKKTIETNVVKLVSESTQGKTIWIDITPISDKVTQVEVRVGAVEADKKLAGDILAMIKKKL
ncbi:MAG: DUF3568 family protein [Candidatus Omnitrophica bacterium]|nr:DUF3568 family protein [Candidatus Omnitrophota bacterium]